MVRRNEQLHAIRAYRQRRAGEGADPHSIGLEIFEGWPGVTRLESWRLGRGWPLDQAAEQIREHLVRHDTAKRGEPGLTGKGLQDIEQGRTRVSLDYAVAIAWTYQIPVELTGLVDHHLQQLRTRQPASRSASEQLHQAGASCMPAPAGGYDHDTRTAPQLQGVATRRRTLFALVGATSGGLVVEQLSGGLPAGPLSPAEIAGSVAEAAAAVRHAEASAVGPTTLELVEHQAGELAAAGRALPRHVMFRRARQYKQDIFALLRSEHTSAEELRLDALAASMNGLIAVALLGVGECGAAWAHAKTAERHANDAQDLELCCWVASTQCMIRYYQASYPDAARLASQATACVRAGSPSAVRLLLNLARASAYAGDPATTARALRQVDRYWNTLPPGSMSNAMFGMNDAFRALYEGTALTVAGKVKDAAAFSEQALALYSTSDPLKQAPAKQGVAWLDLAVGHAMAGEVEQAAGRASAALAGQWADATADASAVDWMVLRRAEDLDRRLADHHGVTAVRGFREQLHQVKQHEHPQHHQRRRQARQPTAAPRD